jgi:hypothetical protein
MTHKSLAKERSTIKQRFIDRRKLLKPFLKKYGKPVLVHAIHDKKVFKKILKQGKLKLPNKHNSSKKTPFMEKILGINNGIYFSLGFVYLTAYSWKYNLLFDINYLKELIYYKSAVNYRCYKAVIDYWCDYDRDHLEKLANKNKKCRAVVDRYYNEEYNGRKRIIFDFWKIEKDVFEHIQEYKNKKKLIKIIQKNQGELKIKYPYSKRDSMKSINTELTPEIIELKEVNLLTNKYFLGFHIEGKIPKDLMNVIKKKYPGKIIFDGKKISKVSEV